MNVKVIHDDAANILYAANAETGERIDGVNKISIAVEGDTSVTLTLVFQNVLVEAPM